MGVASSRLGAVLLGLLGAEFDEGVEGGVVGLTRGDALEEEELEGVDGDGLEVEGVSGLQVVEGLPAGLVEPCLALLRGGAGEGVLDESGEVLVPEGGGAWLGGGPSESRGAEPCGGVADERLEVAPAPRGGEGVAEAVGGVEGESGDGVGLAGGELVSAVLEEAFVREEGPLAWSEEGEGASCP